VQREEEMGGETEKPLLSQLLSRLPGGGGLGVSGTAYVKAFELCRALKKATRGPARPAARPTGGATPCLRRAASRETAGLGRPGGRRAPGERGTPDGARRTARDRDRARM